MQIDDTPLLRLKNDASIKTIDKLKSPVVYSGEQWGMDKKYLGDGVKIAIIDSGFPQHKDIKSTGTYINCSERSDNSYDLLGHSTMVAGIIGGDNCKGIRGFAPGADLFHVKVFEDDGSCPYTAIISGILWSVAHKIDIISISFGSLSDNPVVHDAIKKATDNNICIVASAGNRGAKAADIDFPARYKEVLAIGSVSRGNKMSKFSSNSNSLKVAFPGENVITTYKNNTYTTVSGTTMSCAIATGLLALTIEMKKDLNIGYTNINLYDYLRKMSYRSE